jgi:hypothetical protein
MTDQYRFADFAREHGAGALRVSFNDIFPAALRGADGHLLPGTRPPFRLNAGEVARLLEPYVATRFMDQVRAVVPLAAYLGLFQLLILRQAVEDSWLVTGGLFAVIAGLMLFMEGLKLGLIPAGSCRSNAPRNSTPCSTGSPARSWSARASARPRLSEH